MNIRRKIFEYISDHEAQLNRHPKRGEICHLFSGMAEDVDLHLRQLEREGLINLPDGDEAEVSTIPTFAPAPPITIQSWPQNALFSLKAGALGSTITLDLRALGIEAESDLSIIQVLDRSMSDAGLERGDVAILKAGYPRRGDIVAVEIAGRLMLRRYLIIMEIPHLLAENRIRPDLKMAYEFPMHGILWGMIRVGSRRRASKIGMLKKQISYSRKNQSVGVSMLPVNTTDASSVDACSPVRASKSSGLKREKYSSGTAGDDWPEPPSGIELNEDPGEFHMIEESGHYSTLNIPRRP